MIPPKKFKKYFIVLSSIALALCVFKVLAFFSEPAEMANFESAKKNVEISDNGLSFKLSTSTNSVSELLAENKIELGEYDRLIPNRESALYTGAHIEITRATKVKISADGKTVENYILGKTVREALQESDITLSRLDKTTPEINTLIQNDSAIIVTRINIEEVTKKEAVDFKILVKNDAKLGWQEETIETLGQLGEKEVRYKITYKNGQEISRIILSSEITSAPVAQTEIHGTYMKLGKANSGQGTWYSYQGGLFAASTTIPKGAYAKVTNTANGKSVVVKINDYGPQGKGRIIDLDKVAFAKIASIGAGVIGVKVEPVLN